MPYVIHEISKINGLKSAEIFADKKFPKIIQISMVSFSQEMNHMISSVIIVLALFLEIRFKSIIICKIFFS
jgi:hypothetical protein